MKTMRLVVVLLAAVSLLGLRTGYACAHMGNVPLSTCCCKDGAAQCPKRQKSAGAQAGESCCATTVIAGAAGDQQATKSAQLDKLDLPLVASPGFDHEVILPKWTHAPVHVAHAARDGSLTWLKTARLRL